MNIEFFRRETTKKIVGLTKLPTVNKPVTIAKGLEPIDFMGMIVIDDGVCNMVTFAGVGGDAICIEIGESAYLYYPATGVLSVDGDAVPVPPVG